MLFQDMEEELQKGNYIICGGDFNHNLKADEADSENCESWAYPFPRSRMPEGIGFAMDRLEEEAVANMPESGRNSDMEYILGETFTCTLDGFIISDNIDLKDYKVIDSGFAYSDHEPVFMDFQLK